jgi:ribonuclease-3
VDEKGPAHKKTFTVELTLKGAVLSKKEGNSKKEAEQKAAEEAYYCLQKEKDL